MRAAIYARYSSENQSEKSIDDQIRVCKKYCAEHDITVAENSIFIDEATSGSLVKRPGLSAFENAAENKEFEALVVDDLSRLSRSNHQMLTLVLKFNYLQVKLISVSDGIITDDENSKLGIQMRGLINELYLDDLKKKTMRGLEGQKLRGFSVGENVYGYVTQPVGELKINKKGVAKYDGKVHKINPEEADVVKRIYQDFTSGKSINKIVEQLNIEKIPTKKHMSGGWSISTVSRILKSSKYVGIWKWKTSKSVRDPMSGKRKSVSRPESEHLSFLREDLIIIDKELWNKAQKRWADLKGTWPVSKKKKGFYKQKSYAHTSPTYLLSGLMKCQSCGGAIILISGKGSGYYGCYNARRKSCHNTLLVPRKRIEQIIIQELQQKRLTTENLEYIFKNIEKLAAAGLNEVPELTQKKKAQVEKLKAEIQNYMNFIRSGNISKTVSEALSEAEKKSEELKHDIEGLEFQRNNTFKAPPKEWIDHRLGSLRDTLNKDTINSALALKELLGTVTLEPVLTKESDYYRLFEGTDRNFKPYYVAHTKIQTLALLKEEDKGSNWCQWWRCRESNPGPYMSKIEHLHA